MLPFFRVAKILNWIQLLSYSVRSGKSLGHALIPHPNIIGFYSTTFLHRLTELEHSIVIKRPRFGHTNGKIAVNFFLAYNSSLNRLFSRLSSLIHSAPSRRGFFRLFQFWLELILVSYLSYDFPYIVMCLYFGCSQMLGWSMVNVMKRKHFMSYQDRRQLACECSTQQDIVGCFWNETPTDRWSSSENWRSNFLVFHFFCCYINEEVVWQRASSVNFTF